MLLYPSSLNFRNVTLTKSNLSLFFTWIAFVISVLALASVYLFALLDKIWLGWLCLGLASLPILLWFLHDETKFTPFIIPLSLFLGGGIWGLVTAGDPTPATGIFQTLLASCLSYFLFVHFPFRRALLILGYLGANLGVLVFLLFALGQPLPSGSLTDHSLLAQFIENNPFPFPKLPEWFLTPKSPTIASHGLFLAMLILCLISATLAFSVSKKRFKIVLSLLSCLWLAAIICFGGHALWRLFTAQSLFSRFELWAYIGGMVKEIPFSGLGLGTLINHYKIINPHSAYLQLWSELGILGLLACLASFICFAQVAGSLLISLKRDIWHGFALGLTFGVLASIIIGIVDTAPFASAVPGKESWHLVIIPLFPLLGAGLVSAKRILDKNHRHERLT